MPQRATGCQLSLRKNTLNKLCYFRIFLTALKENYAKKIIIFLALLE
jgi:hypothetical protein